MSKSIFCLHRAGKRKIIFTIERLFTRTNIYLIMKNWDVFIIVSTFIIALALFSSGKISFDNMLNNLQLSETIIVMFKTVTIALLGSFALALMIIFILIDVVVTLVSGIEFPIMQFFYHTVYMDYFHGWYWDMHSGSHIFMACIVLFGIGLINTYMGPVYRKKTYVYHKSKQNNYIKH